MAPDRPEDNRRLRRTRIDLRKNRKPAARRKAWTDLYLEGQDIRLDEQTPAKERIGKTAQTRRRTFIGTDEGLLAPAAEQKLLIGTVLLMRGYFVDVDVDGRAKRCVIRGLLRKRLSDQHKAVTVGDVVCISPVEATGAGDDKPEGVIEAVRPRTSVLARKHDGRLQVIAANVAQSVIVSSVNLPEIRPHLIDRYIVAAEAGNIRPVVCVNKADLDPEGVVDELLELYRSLGYAAIKTSVVTGQGLEELHGIFKDTSSVLVGMSGVGKSSLLNALQPDLRLKIGDINVVLHRGRHTTSAAQLLRLDFGGYVVDTPGIRQLELPDVEPGDLEMYFVEFVDRVKDCKFANCTHVHETSCAVKQAVEAGAIDPDRYESYVRMFTGDLKMD